MHREQEPQCKLTQKAFTCQDQSLGPQVAMMSLHMQGNTELKAVQGAVFLPALGVHEVISWSKSTVEL